MVISYGNAIVEGKEHEGWFVGDFIFPFSPSGIEAKYAQLRVGERKERSAWTRAKGNSLAILIRGEVVMEFEGEEAVLAKKGDYVIWPAGILHGWRANKDSEIITFRWNLVRIEEIVS